MTWSQEDLLNKLAVDEKGKRIIQEFEFYIGKKKVRGWAGILDIGSRNDAGFSILQHNRVIVGWPDSYRPNLLYGFQEGGRNDLTNQRLVGELYMDDFDVSHTKDSILYEYDEEDNLDVMLKERLWHLRTIALTRSVKAKFEPESTYDDNRIQESVVTLQSEFSSPAVRAFIFSHEVPPVDLIQLNNESLLDSIIRRVHPSYSVTINDRLNVDLYIRDDMSPNDPYVLSQATKDQNRVIVIVNASHPFWGQLKGSDVILHYLRHCVYDGVAEWKAYFQGHNLDPDTIKWIKDNLLRMPYRMGIN